MQQEKSKNQLVYNLKEHLYFGFFLHPQLLKNLVL